MGGGSYSTSDWMGFTTKRGYHDPKTTTDKIYSKSSIDKDMDPKNFVIRESVDSNDNPESTPVIIGLDVTGSMSMVLDVMARKGMKTVCEEIYNRKPVTNPHICTLGIGDVEWDTHPFQATQFEADIRIFKQLENIYLEQGGGGNDHESYILAWYFAKYRTKTDSFTKRGKKGFIFTIGDEEITPVIKSDHFNKFFGDQMSSITAQEMFDIVFPEWNVFHVIVKEGSHARRSFDKVRKSWENVIGEQRTIPLDDHTKIGEVIVSTMEVASGKNIKDVAGSWSGDISVTVLNALNSVSVSNEYTKLSIDNYL
jgi:hypothetical protein